MNVGDTEASVVAQLIQNHLYIPVTSFRVTPVLLKYVHPVAKCDPWIQRATEGPTMDGPFVDQWIIYVLQKIFRKKSGQTPPQMHWYKIHGLAQDCSISIANAL